MDAMNAEAIGRRLKDLRSGRTQKEVADAVGVSTMAISQFEAGQRIPKDATKIKLANYFGKTVESIFFN